MRKEMYFKTSGRVRWNDLRARFGCGGPHGWSRSVAVCAREIIKVLEAEGTVTGASGRDDLLLAIDAEVVRRVHLLGRSPAARALRPERGPFPATDVLFRKLAPWWDTAVDGGRSDFPYRHVDEAFPDARGFRERLIADGRREEAWDLQHEMLAMLLIDAFLSVERELYGGDVVQAYSVVSPDCDLPRLADAL